MSARERNLTPKPLTVIRNGVDVGGEDVVDDPAGEVLVRPGVWLVNEDESSELEIDDDGIMDMVLVREGEWLPGLLVDVEERVEETFICPWLVVLEVVALPKTIDEVK